MGENVFEAGKYYRHTSGRELHIVGGPVNTVYHMGPTLVSEELGSGAPCFIGSDEASAVNWVECEPWVIRDHGVYSAAGGAGASELARDSAPDEPKPGSDEARRQGCRCPVDNVRGHDTLPDIEGCPVHGYLFEMELPDAG